MKNLFKVLSLSLFFSLIASEAMADVTGSWTFAVTLGELGSGNATITMTQEADGKLSGTYAGQLANGPVTGTHEGDNFEFSFTSELLGGAVTYRGALKEDGTVAGAVVAGEQALGTFTGTKS